MGTPHFTAFVRIRPDGVEPEVLADGPIQPLDRLEPTTQSTDVPWAAPAEAELDALVEELVGLARAPLALDGADDDLKEAA